MDDAARDSGEGWLRRRLWGPIRTQLRQGLSPEGLAWSVCLALACATCPLIGVTTALCIAAGALFRLNHPVMQVVNYVSYPIQIALLIPFWRLGERIFGAPKMDLDPGRILAAVKADAWGALHAYGAEIWHGVVAWALVAIPAGCLLGWVLGPVARRMMSRGRTDLSEEQGYSRRRP
jgi:uncharacterized protein (DUF2062 family)